MKVAVVIPLHNQARYVGAALESLRVQTRPPDRVIIIDDGSTDGSLNAVIAYSEKIPPPEPAGATPRVQTHTDILPQAHAGPQATINRAVAMAEDCDFVSILNPDDSYHPRRIERCLEYLQAHPRHDLVCTRLRLIDEAGRTLPSDAAARAVVLGGVEFPARVRRSERARPARVARTGQFPGDDE